MSSLQTARLLRKRLRFGYFGYASRESGLNEKGSDPARTALQLRPVRIRSCRLIHSNRRRREREGRLIPFCDEWIVHQASTR